jgi:hypothetical protein
MRGWGLTDVWVHEWQVSVRRRIQLRRTSPAGIHPAGLGVSIEAEFRRSHANCVGGFALSRDMPRTGQRFMGRLARDRVIPMFACHH